MSMSAIPSQPSVGDRAYFRLPDGETKEGTVKGVGEYYEIEVDGAIFEVLHCEVWRSGLRV